MAGQRIDIMELRSLITLKKTGDEQPTVAQQLAGLYAKARPIILPVQLSKLILMGSSDGSKFLTL
jgi:hypothetical protein